MRIKHFPSGPARTSSRTYIYIGVRALFPFTLFHAHFRIHCGGSWLSSAFNLLWITSCPASSPGKHSEWSSLLPCIYTLLPSRFGALRVKHTPSHPQPAKWRVMTPPARCNTLTKHCISRVNLLSVCKGGEEEGVTGRGERSVAGERWGTQPSYAPYALQIMLTLCGHHLLCKLCECCNSVLYIFMLQEEHGTCLRAGR